MGEVKNLMDAEAIEKIRNLAKDADITMFTTNLLTLPLTSRPMSTQDVDEEGNIWFMSRNDSNKNREIAEDNRVQLFYSNRNSSEYLSVYGRAAISRDQEKIDRYWTTIAGAWFTEGKDDPSITLIKVVPTDAYYWDTKENKYVALFKIAISAITGKSNDGGVEGKIRV